VTCFWVGFGVATYVAGVLMLVSHGEGDLARGKLLAIGLLWPVVILVWGGINAADWFEGRDE